MADLGVGAGDRLAIMQVNCTQGIETYFAAAQLDAIYVPINFRAKTEELGQMLRLAAPSYLFIGERYLSMVPTSGEGSLASERQIVLDCEATGGRLGYEELLAGSIPDQLHFPEGGRQRYDCHHVYCRDYQGAQGRDAHPRQLCFLPVGHG